MFESHPQPSTLPGEIVRRMIPTIRRIARQFAKRLPSHVHVDDLIGAGLLALVKAYKRFDPTRGGGFEAYANSRIRGAMLDELRASDPLSRDQRSQVTRIAAETGAPAEEIVTELGIPLEESWSDETEETGHVLLPDAELVDEHLCRKQAQVAVIMAVEALPPRLLRVLELHYVDGLTLREIGTTFGVSESRICQLESEAIRILRTRCRDHGAQIEPKGPRRLRPVRRKHVQPPESAHPSKGLEAVKAPLPHSVDAPPSSRAHL